MSVTDTSVSGRMNVDGISVWDLLAFFEGGGLEA